MVNMLLCFIGTSPCWVCVPKPSAWPEGTAVYLGIFATALFAMLQVITILNRCRHFRGFVYQYARFASDHKSIEIAVRPRCAMARTTFKSPFDLEACSGGAALFICP